jgi:hypothetical protein
MSTTVAGWPVEAVGAVDRGARPTCIRELSRSSVPLKTSGGQAEYKDYDVQRGFVHDR